MLLKQPYKPPNIEVGIPGVPDAGSPTTTLDWQFGKDGESLAFALALFSSVIPQTHVLTLHLLLTFCRSDRFFERRYDRFFERRCAHAGTAGPRRRGRRLADQLDLELSAGYVLSSPGHHMSPDSPTSEQSDAFSFADQTLHTILFFRLLGVPTPNPALLVEVAPPHDNGTPTTLKLGLSQPKPKSTTPIPTPRPVHALHAAGPTAPLNVEIAGARLPDVGVPTTLKWNFPYGEPTPNPALLKGDQGEKLVWGYPPGMPTPGKRVEGDPRSFVYSIHVSIHS